MPLVSMKEAVNRPTDGTGAGGAGTADAIPAAVEEDRRHL